MTTKAQILKIAICLIIPSLVIFYSAQRIIQIIKLSGTENYEYGIVTRIDNIQKSSDVRVYLMAETDNKECSIRTQQYSKYKIGNRAQIVFNNDRSYCISPDFSGELSSYIMLLAIGIIMLLMLIYGFRKNKKEKTQ